MSFASPTLLVALFLLVPAMIAFLVHRRREVLRVPSTLLWRVAARAAAPSRRIRKLRRVVALLACLTALAALVFAAARPSGSTRGETVAVVIDLSASMAAGGARSPLAQARRFAARMFTSAGPGDRYVILAAGASPRRLAGLSAPGPALDEALDHLVPETASADVGAALELGAQLLAGQPNARIVLLGDGGESLGDGVVDLRDVPLAEKHFAPPSDDNLGISAFATRSPQDAASDEEREALVSVASASDRPRRARVILMASGVELARRHVDVPAQGEAEIRVRVHAAATTITARVEPEDGAADALALDDEATLSESARRLPRALLISAACPAGGCSADAESATASSFFAEKALIAAGVKEVVRVTPQLDGAQPMPGDLLVALQDGPTRVIAMPALYLGTTTGVLPFKGARLLDAKETRLRSVEGRDPLLRGVALDGVTIERATAVEVPSSARALVDLDGGTVVLAGGVGQGAFVYLGVDPAKSDLVLRVAFPVLVANALAALGGAERVVSAETVARSEITFRKASVLDRPASAEVAEVAWRLPASPAALLAIVAAALLALEAWMFRKGWAA